MKKIEFLGSEVTKVLPKWCLGAKGFYLEDRQKIDKSHKKIRTISVNNKL